MTKPELLAPAGDFEKLQIAAAYGADAVYLSGTAFGLRAKAKNFNQDELASAINYAHSQNVKVYVTANILAHNRDINEMQGYFATLAELGADAFIISDPGVLTLAKQQAPGVEIHISTQANVTNYASANLWHSLGASRIILARELSLDEIAEIRQNTPNSLQLEGFVHGAMCMAYSGRCMLSRYLSGRDANLGACAHPCRYNYRLYAEEVSRPGFYMPIEENERGTDIFGAEDLNMVEYIPEMKQAGLSSLKIEGRMKTAFYVGLATRTYRLAIDEAFDDFATYKNNASIYNKALKMASHRPFSTGFYFGKPKTQDGFVEATYTRSHNFVGLVKDYNSTTGLVTIEQRNVFAEGETLCFVQPNGMDFEQQVKGLQTADGKPITRAPHAQQLLKLQVKFPVQINTLVCKAAE